MKATQRAKILVFALVFVAVFGTATAETEELNQIKKNGHHSEKDKEEIAAADSADDSALNNIESALKEEKSDDDTEPIKKNGHRSEKDKEEIELIKDSKGDIDDDDGDEPDNDGNEPIKKNGHHSEKDKEEIAADDSALKNIESALKEEKPDDDTEPIKKNGHHSEKDKEEIELIKDSKGDIDDDGDEPGDDIDSIKKNEKDKEEIESTKDPKKEDDGDSIKSIPEEFIGIKNNGHKSATDKLLAEKNQVEQILQEISGAERSNAAVIKKLNKDIGKYQSESQNYIENIKSIADEIVSATQTFQKQIQSASAQAPSDAVGYANAVVNEAERQIIELKETVRNSYQKGLDATKQLMDTASRSIGDALELERTMRNGDLITKVTRSSNEQIAIVQKLNESYLHDLKKDATAIIASLELTLNRISKLAKNGSGNIREIKRLMASFISIAKLKSTNLEQIRDKFVKHITKDVAVLDEHQKHIQQKVANTAEYAEIEKNNLKDNLGVLDSLTH